MARKKRHEEHENHERWLVSYADFITLLFAFFVVMYSVSRTDSKRLENAAQSIKWALHYSGTGGVGQMPIFEGPPSEGGCAANIGAGQWASPKGKKVIENIRKRLERALKPFLVEQRTVSITLEPGRVAVRLAASRFFDPGQAALRPEALPVVDAIAAELAALGRPIRVEGHSDDEPLRQGRFRNNWELSASRAASVADYLEKAHKIDKAKLTAAGMGSGRPVASNATPEGREQNRRIELVVELDPSDALNFAVR